MNNCCSFLKRAKHGKQFCKKLTAENFSDYRIYGICTKNVGRKIMDFKYVRIQGQRACQYSNDSDCRFYKIGRI